MNLYVSDDFFKTQKIALKSGNSIIKSDHFMFVAKAHDTKQGLVQIYISEMKYGFLDFKKAFLPFDALTSKTFTVMDASEWSAFLHIQTQGANSPIGNIYISEGSGTEYSLTLDNVLRGSSYVDFEKINSLTGVYIANKFDPKREQVS